MKNYFEDSELACKCGCGTIIKPDVGLLRLNYARLNANTSFALNSATRCPEHNTKEGGKDYSDHLTGEGWDIACGTSRARFLILEGAIKAGITRIGIGNTFIHLGTRSDIAQRVVWLY